MRWKSLRLIVLPTLFLATETVRGAVNLEWRPSILDAAQNDFAEVGLFAVSDTASSQAVAAIEVIVTWDPAKLELVGIVNNGPYSWLSSHFPNDAIQDGLNAPYTGIPANDGNAWYNALSRFPPNPTAVATPEGLLVTAFRFRVLSTAPALITMTPHIGSDTYTQVWSGDVPGLTVTGTLGSPAVINGPAIPAMGTWGLVITILLTLCVGTVVTARQQHLSCAA